MPPTRLGHLRSLPKSELADVLEFLAEENAFKIGHCCPLIRGSRVTAGDRYFHMTWSSENRHLPFDEEFDGKKILGYDSEERQEKEEPFNFKCDCQPRVRCDQMDGTNNFLTVGALLNQTESGINCVSFDLEKTDQIVAPAAFIRAYINKLESENADNFWVNLGIQIPN